MSKDRAPRNRTLTIEESEKSQLRNRTKSLTEPVLAEEITNQIINADLFDVVRFLPQAFIDLLIIDPPYNLSKDFNGRKFTKTSDEAYEEWLHSWMRQLIPCLKRTASIYVCCDWKSSAPIQRVLEAYFIVRNRITWEREKGRGATSNWKNCSEDIWFCTVSEDYFFDVEAVKVRRKVIAPYRHGNGEPKDWEQTDLGNFRLTHPSNLWTDISIPFWSMPENTNHPTQKPEKLVAKLILASSKPGDFVFDPFLGSGTSCVVAKKLGRLYAGVEIDQEYSCMSAKRLIRADNDTSIQGYHDGHFWERNSLAEQKAAPEKENGQSKKRERGVQRQQTPGGLFDE